MELASNLVWLVAAILALAATWLAARRGMLRVSTAKALTMVFLIGVLLLPAMSMSDDLLMASHPELPYSAQSWRLAWESASVGLELLPILCACVLLLVALAISSQAMEAPADSFRLQSAWLTRSLRLRPPPTRA